MSKRIPLPTEKPCLVCQRPMLRADYYPAQFRVLKTCSNKCSGVLRASRADSRWSALMAFQIKDEMGFEAIAAIAGVSRQRIESIYLSAMRKLKNNAAAYKRLRELQ